MTASLLVKQGGLLQRNVKVNLLSRAVASRGVAWFNGNKGSLPFGTPFLSSSGATAAFPRGQKQLVRAQSIFHNTAEKHYVPDLEAALNEIEIGNVELYRVLGSSSQRASEACEEQMESSSTVALEDTPMNMNAGMLQMSRGMNGATYNTLFTFSFCGCVIIFSELGLLMSFAGCLFCDASSAGDHPTQQPLTWGSGYVGHDALLSRMSCMASVLLALSTFTYGACLTLNPVGYTEISVMFFLFGLFYTADVQHELMEFARSKCYTGSLIFLHMTHIYASILGVLWMIFMV